MAAGLTQYRAYSTDEVLFLLSTKILSIITNFDFFFLIVFIGHGVASTRKP